MDESFLKTRIKISNLHSQNERLYQGYFSQTPVIVEPRGIVQKSKGQNSILWSTQTDCEAIETSLVVKESGSVGLLYRASRPLDLQTFDYSLTLPAKNCTCTGRVGGLVVSQVTSWTKGPRVWSQLSLNYSRKIVSVGLPGVIARSNKHCLWSIVTFIN